DNECVSLVEADASIQGGQMSFRTVWESGGHPTAVVTMADVIALGVLQAAPASGLNVPQDISIIGYDDIEASHSAQPPLSTVRQPTVHKGESAAHLLMLELRQRKRLPEHLTLPVALVQRQSIHHVLMSS